VVCGSVWKKANCALLASTAQRELKMLTKQYLTKIAELIVTLKQSGQREEAALIIKTLKEAGIYEDVAQTLSKDVSEFWPEALTPGIEKEKKVEPAKEAVKTLKKLLSTLPGDAHPTKQRDVVLDFFKKHPRYKAIKDQIVDALFTPGLAQVLKQQI
jgi:hypothetical protein